MIRAVTRFLNCFFIPNLLYLLAIHCKLNAIHVLAKRMIELLIIRMLKLFNNLRDTNIHYVGLIIKGNHYWYANNL